LAVSRLFSNLHNMKGKALDHKKVLAAEGRTHWPGCVVLAVICVSVVCLLGLCAKSGMLEYWGSGADKSYYNLLVQSFRAGQLDLKIDAPAGLAQLADPYDPAANLPYRWIAGQPLHDLSYYKGKFYLYWGVTPALVLFWPYVAVTGHYLSHRAAAVIFCVAGFLTGVGILYALWRRYFPQVGVGVIAAGALALGLAPGLPAILSRCDVYEVAISCGYAFATLALAALWCALHEPQRRGRWLAAASLAYGLAVGARPSLLPGVVILLLPLVQAWREPVKNGRGRRIYLLLLAATGPVVLVGLGLLYYNALRFGDPREFGQRYQLALERQDTMQHFSWRYLWFNFRVYFLEPARLIGRFPFVEESHALSLPAGHVPVQRLFGILPGIPFVLLALAAPLAWRDETAKPRTALRLFTYALGLLFGICLLVTCLFSYTCVRYVLDFLPVLLLLAVVGVLGLERTLAARPARLRVVRWGCGLLLAYSLIFNLLAGFEHRAMACNDLGHALLGSGRADEAIAPMQKALRWDAEPGFVAEVQNNLGNAFADLGRTDAAIQCYRLALRSEPDEAEAHNNLGIIMAQTGRLDEALVEFHAAILEKPDDATIHNSLGGVLLLQGQYQEALTECGEAVRLNPNYAEAQNNWGYIWAKMGRFNEAVPHYQAALRLKDDYFQARYNLGCAFIALGRRDEAVAQFQQILQSRPDDSGVRQKLQELLRTPGSQ
jgi:Flp pilus assembly protein TadD